MGLTDVLRTRADGSEVEEEILQLREIVAELRKDQEKTSQELSQLREAMVKAKAEAEAANQKTQMIKRSLKESIVKNDELKTLLKEERRKALERRHTPDRAQQGRGTEYMDVEIIPPPHNQRKGAPLPPLW